MSLLRHDIAKAIFSGFKNKLLTGTLRKAVPSGSGALDEYGDPIDIAVITASCQGFLDQYSDSFRALAGIPEQDLKVSIFAQSMPGVRPDKDDKVNMDSRWFQIRKVAIDPADALWVCQSFECKTP